MTVEAEVLGQCMSHMHLKRLELAMDGVFID
jgi:hypothetical protein